MPALQTQHPGIYFHKAAEYIQRRKEAFLQCNGKLIKINFYVHLLVGFLLIGPLTPTEAPNSFNGQTNNITSLYTEYFGIRSLKSGEPLTEQQINLIIRENEKFYNHSVMLCEIIRYLKIFIGLLYHL